jgi:hypothetical protein
VLCVTVFVCVGYDFFLFFLSYFVDSFICPYFCMYLFFSFVIKIYTHIITVMNCGQVILLLTVSRSVRLGLKPLIVTHGHILAWKKISELSFVGRDSSVGIALGYGLDERGSRVRFPAGAANFSLRHRVKNGSGVHPASYPMGTRGSFPGDKAAGA